MREPMGPGSTVVLLGCRAWTQTDGAPEEAVVTGLFDLAEWCPRDPAAYCWDEGWLVTNHGDDEIVLFIAWDDMWPQVRPSEYATQLALERDAANHEEVQYA